ncbi:MAG: LytR/AlgR family response regulator transcription factor [Cellulosilyticaceae bacterium]
MLGIVVVDTNLENLESIVMLLHQHNRKEEFKVMAFQTWDALIEAHQNNYHFDILLVGRTNYYKNQVKTSQCAVGFNKHISVIMLSYTEQDQLKKLIRNEVLYEINQITESEQKAQKHVVTISEQEGITKIAPNEIHYFESELHNIHMVTANQRYTFSATIRDIENQMKLFGFERIHKSYVVNLRYVCNINKDTITMENGDKLPLSKHRHKTVTKMFYKYLEHEKVPILSSLYTK